MLWGILLLCLCSVNGQSWRDRFVPFDLHNLNSDPDQINTKARYTVLAPDVLRTDNDENLLLQVDGPVSGPVSVSIQIWDFSKSRILSENSTTLTETNGYHALQSIQLPSENLKPEEKKDQFVYLKVMFDGFEAEERLILVSFHRGFIFIQTDKPIYNPGDRVLFRAYVSSPVFKAVDGTITVDVKNPDGIVVWQTSKMKAANGVFKGNYILTELVKSVTFSVLNSPEQGGP